MTRMRLSKGPIAITAFAIILVTRILFGDAVAVAIGVPHGCVFGLLTGGSLDAEEMRLHGQPATEMGNEVGEARDQGTAKVVRLKGSRRRRSRWDIAGGLPVVLDDGNQYVYGAGLAG